MLGLLLILLNNNNREHTYFADTLGFGVVVTNLVYGVIVGGIVFLGYSGYHLMTKREKEKQVQGSNIIDHTTRDV